MSSTASDIIPSGQAPVRLDDTDDTPLWLPVDHIDVQPGFNPRRFFDPVRYRKLIESVRLHGRVFQAIVVRPQRERPEHYWVIAGERRWRAAREVGLTHLPALALDLSDEEALAIAENLERADLSPGEEALSAQRMMTLTQGDRQEAAKRLGWTPRLLDARLLLTQAIEPVLMALAEGTIKLGHAELLSALPETTQSGTLQEIIARKLPMEELRAKLDAFALDLATACFDKTGCQGCPHNTTLQASLFEQNVGEGRCTNRPCFHHKTVEHLEGTRVALRDEYNAVYLDTERDRTTWALVLKREVGVQQLTDGCQQCANFGCLLSSRPGEAGKFINDVCFNLTCRQEKIAAHEATLRAAEVPTLPSSGDSSPAPPSSATKKSNTTRKANAAAAASAPKRVQEIIHSVQRRAAAAEVLRNPKMAQVFAILALLRELGLMHSSRDAHDPLTKRGIQRGSHGDPRHGLIAALYALEASALNDITAELSACIAERELGDTVTQNAQYLKGAQTTLHVLDVDLAQHFVLDAAFLEAHTKSGMESLLSEAKFPAYYNDTRKDSAAFKQLLGRKHAEIVKQIMASGFDFKGFVPQSLRVPAK